MLRDGSTTHVRPIRPEDADALQRFHMTQSERSTYLRFFAALQRIPERMLTQFVTVDHVSRAALVAVRPGTGQDADAGERAEDIVGVARYDVTDDQPGRRTAEVAFNIADAHQGRASGRSCWSTSPPRRASGACTGSSPRCCPRTGDARACSGRRATPSSSTWTTAS